MYMTEDKAKEILDFLARRIGFDETDICPVITNSFASDYLVICKHSNSSIRYALCFDETIKHPIYINSSSFINVLEKLFKFSRCMKENIYCGSSKRIFLKYDVSLEEILIEMDLERWF